MALSIVFVCLGNICRSPMAEGAFRTEADKAGLTITIDSAGIGNWHVSESPDPRAVKIAADHGVDISEQAARQITRHDFKRYDYIVAMDVAVLNDLRTKLPEGETAKISLFLDHVEGREGEDVADPYYGGDEGFAAAWADCVAGARALAEKFHASA